jgi:hypothetical protein
MSGVGAGPVRGRLRCADAVHSRVFDDEIVILDMAKGQYFALDEVGARLWAALEAGRTVEEVAREIAGEYEVAVDRALADLTALRDEFLASGLMVARDEG